MPSCLKSIRLEVRKVHNTTLLSRGLGSKDKQVGVQDLLRRDTQYHLVPSGDRVDKCPSQSGVTTAVVSAFELWRMVCSFPGQEVKDILTLSVL